MLLKVLYAAALHLISQRNIGAARLNLTNLRSMKDSFREAKLKVSLREAKNILQFDGPFCAARREI